MSIFTPIFFCVSGLAVGPSCRAGPSCRWRGQARPGGRARLPSGRAVLGPGQNAVPWAGPSGLGPFGHLYLQVTLLLHRADLAYTTSYATAHHAKISMKNCHEPTVNVKHLFQLSVTIAN